MSGSIVQLPVAERVEWLRWRRLGIGASDAAAICGMSRWDTPYSLWLDKTGQLPLQEDDNPEQRWGKLLEPGIIQAFEEDTNLLVVDRQMRVVHSSLEWMRATLDGRVTDGERLPTALYEGKTSHGWDWHDGVPRYYALQGQHQMTTTGMERVYLAVLIAGSDFQIHELEHSERLARVLAELEHDFWHGSVLRRVPPPADASERTARAIKAAFPAPTITRVELPAEAADLARAHRRGKALERQGKAQAAAAQNALTALLGEAEEGWIGDEQIVRWPLITSRRLDEKALRKARPEIAEEFTRPTTHRRLWVMGETE